MMGRGSMYGGRGSAMARGSFMINSRIAEEDEEDENNDTFEGTALSISFGLEGWLQDEGKFDESDKREDSARNTRSYTGS